MVVYTVAQGVTELLMHILLEAHVPCILRKGCNVIGPKGPVNIEGQILCKPLDVTQELVNRRHTSLPCAVTQHDICRQRSNELIGTVQLTQAHIT